MNAAGIVAVIVNLDRDNGGVTDTDFEIIRPGPVDMTKRILAFHKGEDHDRFETDYFICGVAVLEDVKDFFKKHDVSIDNVNM